MRKKRFAVIFMVTAMVILIGGQAVWAAPVGKAQVTEAKWDAAYRYSSLRLMDEEEAVRIAKAFIPSRQLQLESVQLTIVWDRIAWEVELTEENSYATITYQVLVDLVSGQILDYRIEREPVSQPTRVDWQKAAEIAKKEAARPVTVKATAHMKNSGYWTVNLAQRDADPADRIFVTIREEDGSVVERGWIKNGQVLIAKISPEEAAAIASRAVNYRAKVVEVGLALDQDMLVYEVSLSRTGGKKADTEVFLINAFSGRILD